MKHVCDMQAGQMGKTIESEKTREKPENCLPDLKEISDQEVVRLCIARRRDAWEEFFTRFDPVLREAITRTLKKHAVRNYFYFNDDDEAVWEIHEKIVTRLYRDGLLAKCSDTAGVGRWLWTVAVNQTKDSLKGQGRQKKLPEQSTEVGMRSLDAPLFEDSETTFGEMLADETTVERNEAEYAEAVLNALDQMQDRKKYWILRLGILAVLSFTPEEMDDLYDYSPMAVDAVREKLKRIATDVEARQEKRRVDLGRAVLLFYQLRRLESRLSDAKEDVQAIGMLEEEIAAKTKKREFLLEKTIKLPRPSNSDIAELVGMPEEQQGQISVILARVREEIGKKWGKPSPGDEDD